MTQIVLPLGVSGPEVFYNMTLQLCKSFNLEVLVEKNIGSALIRYFLENEGEKYIMKREDGTKKPLPVNNTFCNAILGFYPLNQ